MVAKATTKHHLSTMCSWSQWFNGNVASPPSGMEVLIERVEILVSSKLYTSSAVWHCSNVAETGYELRMVDGCVVGSKTASICGVFNVRGHKIDRRRRFDARTFMLRECLQATQHPVEWHRYMVSSCFLGAGRRCCRQSEFPNKNKHRHRQLTNDLLMSMHPLVWGKKLREA